MYTETNTRVCVNKVERKRDRLVFVSILSYIHTHNHKNIYPIQ